MVGRDGQIKSFTIGKNIVKNQSFAHTIKVGALSAVLAVFLSSCAMQSAKTGLTTDIAFGPLTQTTSQYRQLADSSDQDSQYQAMILLARSYITSGDLANAKAIVSELNTLAVTPLQQDEAKIISALISVNENNLIEAATDLEKVNALTLPNQAAAYYHQLNSRVQSNLYKQTGNKDNLLKAYSSQKVLVDLINDDAKKAVLNETIKNLELLGQNDLSLELERAADPLDSGYFEYAIIDSSKNRGAKQELFNQFVQKYPTHPLNLLISARSSALEALSPAADHAAGTASLPQLKNGDEIAVILPLSGRFVEMIGKPAQLGILAALKDRSEKVNVTFYDSNVLTMDQILTAAKQKGTAFILGAVLKPEVSDLIASGTKIPAIVYNKVDTLPDNIWYFDLSPDYEGALAAAKMLSDNRRNPVIFASRAADNQRAAQGFNQLWSKVRHQNAAVCSFETVSDAGNSVAACPLSDKDSAYINANAVEAAAVKSKLPATMPVYLTASSNPGLNNSSIEIAMSGAYLGDSPWMLTDTPIKQSLFNAMPKANALVQRIFATAYDSVNTAFNLNNLNQNKADVLHGLTGDIQINGHLIETAPLWITAGTVR